MRKRAERPLKDLYDRTQRIAEPEITPVLEGSCRIQGPVDESDHELCRTNSGISPEKKFTFVNERFRMGSESGTCNVCSAPCSSCMHIKRTVSAMESKIECGFSGNTCGRKETDSCSFIGVGGMPLQKSRKCDDSPNAASEMSNILSASSSHDSYSENAESKATCKASVAYDVWEDVDMPAKAPLGEKFQEDQHLLTKANVTAPGFFSSSLNTSLSPDDEQHGLECHGDNISCITGVRDFNAAIGDHNAASDKKDAACSSASTSSLLGTDIEKLIHVEATGCVHAGENEESNNLKKPTSCPEESLQKESCNSDKSDLAEVPLSKNDPSSKVQFASSLSNGGGFSCDNADFKVLTDNSSSQLLVDGESSLGPPSAAGLVCEQNPNTLGNTECSKVSPILSGCSSGALKIADLCLEAENGMDCGLLSDEAINSSATNKQSEKPSTLVEACSVQEPEVQPGPIAEGENAESDLELDDVKVCDICGDAGREDLLAICSRCSDGAEHTYCMREMLRKVPEGDWLCEECQLKEDTENMKVDRPHKVSEISKECKLRVDTENKKVDKSETVSATRKECKLKGTENKKVDKSEIVSGLSKLISPNESSQTLGNASSFKRLSKQDTKALDADVRGSPKGLTSPQFLAKRHTDSQEVISAGSKKSSELIVGSIEAASPRKKSALSRESSFKNLDTGKSKLTKMPPSCEDQSTNSAQAFSRSQSSSSSILSKVHAQLQLPSGPLSRSFSFNNLNAKPKVKQLTDNILLKPKFARESSSSDTRKEALVRSMSKSKSFKSGTSGRTSIETGNKTQFIRRSQVEDPRGLKHTKGKILSEKKNSPLMDRPLASSSPRAATSVPLSKVDMKVSQHDGKLGNLSESDGLSMTKGSDDANILGGNEVKKQSLHSSKSSGSASFNARGSTEDQRQCQAFKEGARGSTSVCDKLCSTVETASPRGVPQSTESFHRDDKIKDPTPLSSSRQTLVGGHRILRCQKCNETGHATQFCSIDKIRLSALKPSAERSLRDGNKKGSKWKDLREAKTRIQKISRQPGQSDDHSVSTADFSIEVASKDPASSCTGNLSLEEEITDKQELSRRSDTGPCDTRNLSLEEGVTDKQELSRRSDTGPCETPHVADMEMQHVQPVEPLCPPRVSGLTATITVSAELNMQSLMHVLPDQASILENPFRASAIPEFDFIWQGGFEVQTTGRDSEHFDGIQAHLSTCASPKVLEVASKFPCKLQLAEVSRIISWPSQFQGISPKEDNIALFFFAKDVDSYKKSYSKMLENMLKNDLALRGNIDGVELLIFPSNMLPVNSQRWNRLFFLWGVFRGRTDFLKSIPGPQKKLCGPIQNVDPLVQQSPAPLNLIVSSSQKSGFIEDSEKESPVCDGSANEQTLKSTACGNVCPVSSSEIQDKVCNAQESALAHDYCSLSAVDNRLQLDHVSCSLPVSCPLRSISQDSNMLGAHLESRFQMTPAQSCSEVKSDIPYLRNFGSRSEVRNISDLSACVRANSEEIDLNRASPLYSTSLDCRPGTEGNRNDEELREKEGEGSVKSEACLDDGPLGNPTVMDQISSDLRPNRKRPHSCSTDTIPQTSGETSKSTGETIRWKDKEECLSIDDERERKRKCFGGEHASSSFIEEAYSAMLSSKVHPLLASFSSGQQHRKSRDADCNNTVMPHDSSRSGERHFFPIEPTPIRNTNSDNLVHILSSDDEDAPESKSPNLELALGGRKKMPRSEALPLFLQPAVRKRSQEQPLVLTANDEDDVPASLSLSLAVPASQERITKPLLKSDQLLPERPHVNTSLLLFGGFPDSSI